jgi:2,4'-dihydroxyacetophenone dioxygenase
VIVARALERAGLADWMAECEGKWSLPTQFLPDDAGWAELMHLSPGTRLSLHRHTGEVHALTLAGERRLNDGRVVRPGDYIHEPAGNMDWRDDGHRNATGACGGQGQRGVPGAAPYGGAADHHG